MTTRRISVREIGGEQIFVSVVVEEFRQTAWRTLKSFEKEYTEPLLLHFRDQNADQPLFEKWSELFMRVKQVQSRQFAATYKPLKKKERITPVGPVVYPLEYLHQKTWPVALDSFLQEFTYVLSNGVKITFAQCQRQPLLVFVKDRCFSSTTVDGL